MNTYNLRDPTYVKILRPNDKTPRYLFTYLFEGENRLRLHVSPHAMSTATSLLGNAARLSSRNPLIFAKKIHRFTHAGVPALKMLCKQADILNEGLSKALIKVMSSCDIRASSGRPANIRKVSLSHLSATFDKEVQVDFFWTDINAKKTTVLHIICVETYFR